MELLKAALGGVGGAGLLSACAATIGNFDGMHVGHRRLVAETVAAARTRGVPSVVVTFDPHPSKTISPGGGLALLMTPAQKLDVLESLGVDAAWVIPFGRDTSLLPPDAFMDALFGALNPVEIHVGLAFRFGRDRAGDVLALDARGKTAGCPVRAHSYAAPDGGPVSSSRVRRLLLDGDVSAAHELLGAPFRLTGVVVEGERRGRRLGFPTANLAWEQELLPAPGVYATIALCGALPSGGRALGATNIGTKPTFGGLALTVETHLPGLGADAGVDLYGARMELDFLHRVRGEETFPGPGQLRARIAQDVEIALALSHRSCLAERPKNALAPLDPKEWAKFDGGWV
jgi:riboflavin kinase/FMN adenylyltransferase